MNLLSQITTSGRGLRPAEGAAATAASVAADLFGGQAWKPNFVGLSKSRDLQKLSQRLGDTLFITYSRRIEKKSW